MRLEECAVIGGMQIWALDPHHLPPAVIRRWWKYLLFTREQPQLHQHCNQILSLSPRWCKNQQSSPKHPNRSSRVIPVSRRVLSCQHFLFSHLGGSSCFWGSHFFWGLLPQQWGFRQWKRNVSPGSFLRHSLAIRLITRFIRGKGRAPCLSVRLFFLIYFPTKHWQT